jgi:hypothetical protein
MDQAELGRSFKQYAQGRNLSVMTKERNDFLAWSEANDLKAMKVRQYTNLRKGDGPDYFTYWIERKTTHCGGFRAASSFGYGVYHAKGTDGYRTAEQRRKHASKAVIQLGDAETYFDKVRGVLLDLKGFKLLEEVKPLDINFARKVAYLYNPDKLLPIFKNEVILAIAKFFGIKDRISTDDYQATAVVLQELVKLWKLDQPSFELTQLLGGFLWKYFGKAFDLEHKNIIFYGAPGTGKTYSVMEGIRQKIALEGSDPNQVVAFAQFHPSYSYEDFIEGLRPVDPGNGMRLVLQAGRFKAFCKQAMDHLREARRNGTNPQNYYFVADEINRAELSRVLGEVLVCLEESKRIDFVPREDNPAELAVTGLAITTQYGHLIGSQDDAVLTDQGKHYFGVPANLYFIGTMNDVDRSIDSFDMALRRRFVWERMDCDYSVIEEALSGEPNLEEYLAICESLNDFIRDDLDMGYAYEIGHAYFLDVGAGKGSKRITAATVKRLFDTKIRPLLAQYLRAEYREKEVEDKLDEAAYRFSLGKKDEDKKAKNARPDTAE